MGTVDVQRRFDIERTALWEHLADPANWPAFYNNMLDARSSGYTAEPGDVVEITYRILGRTISGTVTVLDAEPARRIRLRTEADGLPPVVHEWSYEDAPDGAVDITVRMEHEPVDRLFGRALDRFVVPRQLEKDMERSLDNLQEMIGVTIEATG